MAIDSFYGFVSTLDWSKLGTSLGESIQSALTTIDWETLGKSVSDGFIGLLDFITEDDSYVIYTDSNSFIEVKDALTNMGYDKFIVSEVTFVPNNYMELDEESTEKVINLIDALNDLDDVQNVYHNLDI